MLQAVDEQISYLLMTDRSLGRLENIGNWIPGQYLGRKNKQLAG